MNQNNYPSSDFAPQHPASPGQQPSSFASSTNVFPQPSSSHIMSTNIEQEMQYDNGATRRLVQMPKVLDKTASFSVGQKELVMTRPADSSLEEQKDTKYRERRQRNNMAAKKSRDARRVRENQLRIKVLCLENANQVLREQVQREQEKVRHLIDKLNKAEKENEELKLSNTCQYCMNSQQTSHPTSHGLSNDVIEMEDREVIDGTLKKRVR